VLFRSGAQVLAERLIGQRFDMKERLGGLRNPLDIIAGLVERC
jgi:hypothetical protein